jgi:hypothetical protein
LENDAIQPIELVIVDFGLLTLMDDINIRITNVGWLTKLESTADSIFFQS